MIKPDGLFRVIFLIICWSCLYTLVIAQDSSLRPVSSTYALTNATVVQAPGQVIDGGTVVIDKGVIRAVGSNVAVPANAAIIPADSMYVYAGFISGLSTIGVKKPKEKEKKDDRKLTGTPSYERAGITPNVSVRDLLKNNEKSVDDFRKLGFTAAQTVPHKGMIPGTGSLILLTSSSGKSMIFKENTTMYSQLQGADGVYPNTVIGVMAKYRDLYRKADQARNYQARYDSNSNGMERPDTDIMLESFYPVISKQIPVSFKAGELLEILRAIALKKELGFNLVLAEVKQGWDAIPSIKAAKTPVFLSLDLPEMEEEESEEQYEEPEEKDEPTDDDKEKEALEGRKAEMIENYYTQPAKFASQGVPFGFSTMDGKAKNFKETIMKIIDNGLSEDQALAALTIIPAQILGVSSTMSTVETGKIANLVVTDKPYFEEKSNVRYVFVDGEKYEYEVKDKKSSDEEDIDPAGTWSYSTEIPEGDSSGTISITGTPGSYQGTITLSFNDSTNDIQDLLVDGNNISFSFITNIDEEITIDISMDVDDDTFEGSFSIADFGAFPMEGDRTDPPK